jgi:hypothetical protein
MTMTCSSELDYFYRSPVASTAVQLSRSVGFQRINPMACISVTFQANYSDAHGHLHFCYATQRVLQSATLWLADLESLFVA